MTQVNIYKGEDTERDYKNGTLPERCIFILEVLDDELEREHHQWHHEI